MTPAGVDAARLREALGDGAARVLLGSDLCRHFVYRAPAGLRSLAELRTLATARARQLFGDAAPAWTVVADWRLSQPFVCAAVPSALLAALAPLARGPVESSVLVALHNVVRRRPGTGFIAWATPASVVLAHVGPHGVDGLRCLPRPTSAAGDDLAGLVEREALQERLRSGTDTATVWLAAGARTPRALAGRVEVRGWDARDALPPATAGEPEAAWAARLGTFA